MGFYVKPAFSCCSQENWAIRCGLGDFHPVGMLQPKGTQSVGQGSVVAWGCRLNVGVGGVGVLGCSRVG